MQGEGGFLYDVMHNMGKVSLIDVEKGGLLDVMHTMG
jgi:hypothetical protein